MIGDRSFRLMSQSVQQIAKPIVKSNCGLSISACSFISVVSTDGSICGSGITQSKITDCFFQHCSGDTAITINLRHSEGAESEISRICIFDSHANGNCVMYCTAGARYAWEQITVSHCSTSKYILNEVSVINCSLNNINTTLTKSATSDASICMSSSYSGVSAISHSTVANTSTTSYNFALVPVTTVSHCDFVHNAAETMTFFYIYLSGTFVECVFVGNTPAKFPAGNKVQLVSCLLDAEIEDAPLSGWTFAEITLNEQQHFDDRPCHHGFSSARKIEVVRMLARQLFIAYCC